MSNCRLGSLCLKGHQNFLTGMHHSMEYSMIAGAQICVSMLLCMSDDLLARCAELSRPGPCNG